MRGWMAAVRAPQTRQDFIIQRLHTLTGVVPVGLFLLIHLSANATAMNGAREFNIVANILEHLPFLHVLEFLFIFLPLVYHAIFGLYVVLRSGYNTPQYSWFRNQMFVLQRYTGVIVFVFIVYHLWTTRFSGHPPTFGLVHGIVQNPFEFWFMIIGTVSTVFHFCNGLWSFCVHWGITVGPGAQRANAFLTMVLFVAMSYVGVHAILAFHA